jgi:uncharacterized RDD family membrane protein YckC
MLQSRGRKTYFNLVGTPSQDRGVAPASQLLTALISPLRQRVGDMVAGTVVVAPEGEGDERN